MSDNVEGFTFTWVIENFSMLPHKNGEELNSDTFTVDQLPNVEWHLSLFPKGDYDCEGDISLYLSTSFMKDLEPKVTYSITIVSTEPSSDKSGLVENYAFKTLYSDDFLNFVSLNIINEFKELYLPNDTMTVRCCLRPADESSKNSIVPAPPSLMKSCNSRTSIQVNRRIVTLSVPNIEICSKFHDTTSFVLETALTKYPGLKITLDFTKLASDRFVPIEICQTSLPFYNQWIFVKCKITILSAIKMFQHSKESVHLFEYSLNDVWKFPEFLLASNLTRDKYLYLDDTLLLQCEFAFSQTSTVYHVENNYAPLTFEAKKDRSASELVANMADLYLEGKFCDVELHAGDQIFPAQKLVLCAMSPVFRAMFENDTKEKDSNVVEIEDVDPDTVRSMLAFMHTDSLKEDLTFENAIKLFSAADKYNVVSLKRRCSLVLVSSLSVVNVCDVLSLADARQDNFLLTAVHNFIHCHANEIFHSNKWKTLMALNPKLSGEIMHLWIKNR